MIELTKIRYNKETNEESIQPLFLREDEVICLYRDSRGVYLVTKQGFMHRVPYKLAKMNDFFNNIWK
jgi:hypothetical protein